MSARFLIRFDDMCPTMNWEVWHKLEAIMIEEDIRPIVAVIPDNKDQALYEDEPNEQFWEHVRSWQAREWTIGLHGYQHQYVSRDAGIIGLNRYSEFAGLPLKEQRAKLEKGLEIFAREGVRPDVWVAPAHSFDANTVKALASLGIHKISDGLSLYPHRDRQDVLWVPQQLWRLRTVPFGVWTVCIHAKDELYTNLADFRQCIREHRQSITTFPAVVAAYSQRKRNWMDDAFAEMWGLALRVKATVAARSDRGRQLAKVIESDSGPRPGLNTVR